MTNRHFSVKGGLILLALMLAAMGAQAQTYTYTVVDGGGNAIISATSTSSTLAAPANINSPWCDLTYWDAATGGTELDAVPGVDATIYVRYTVKSAYQRYFDGTTCVEISLRGYTNIWAQPSYNSAYKEKENSQSLINTDYYKYWRMVGDPYSFKLYNVRKGEGTDPGPLSLTSDISSGTSDLVFSTNGIHYSDLMVLYHTTSANPNDFAFRFVKTTKEIYFNINSNPVIGWVTSTRDDVGNKVNLTPHAFVTYHLVSRSNTIVFSYMEASNDLSAAPALNANFLSPAANNFHYYTTQAKAYANTESSDIATLADASASSGNIYVGYDYDAGNSVTIGGTGYNVKFDGTMMYSLCAGTNPDASKYLGFPTNANNRPQNSFTDNDHYLFRLNSVDNAHPDPYRFTINCEAFDGYHVSTSYQDGRVAGNHNGTLNKLYNTSTEVMYFSYLAGGKVVSFALDADGAYANNNYAYFWGDNAADTWVKYYGGGGAPAPVVDATNLSFYSSADVVIFQERSEKLQDPVISISLTGEATLDYPDDEVADVALYYTKGTGAFADPTAIPANLYSSAVQLDDGETIKAIAVKSGWINSDVASDTWHQPAVATPVVTISSRGVVTISCATEGADFYYNYTTDGSNPADPTTGSTHWEGSLTISASVGDVMKIKVLATHDHMTNSAIASASNTRSNYTTAYYALHQNGKGYLRVNNANVTLSNDGGFKYGNLYDGNGNSIWVHTEEGYLQNGPYYLNVANDQTLYLSVHHVTHWDLEDIAGNTHGKKSVSYTTSGGTKLYLCNDGNITLAASPSGQYNACPITLTEVSWSGPSGDSYTVQSPQLVTYLRQYFTQKVNYEFYNDKGAGDRVAENNKDRRVHALLEYSTGGSGKGSTWDITDGVIYNKQASGNVDVTATYNLLPADPIARAAHSTPATKDYKLTLQPFSFTPDGDKDYLIFYTENADYRFLNDAEDVNGYAGPGVSKTYLTEPADVVENISWKIERDARGFYSFKNVSTGKYLYFDNSEYVTSVTDYGTLMMGASSLPPSDTRYKFRIYKSSKDPYGDVWAIIPYDMQFVVYKSDAVANDINSGLNVYKESSFPTKVVSVYKPGDSRWKFYSYEVEHRLTDNWIISGPDIATETGSYNFTANAWYSRNIKDSPKNNRDLEINGTHTKTPVTYTWTYPDNTTGNTYTKTDNSGGGDGRYNINITELTSAVSNTLQVVARVDAAHGDKSVTKTIAFNLVPAPVEPVSWTEITALSQITSATGNYKLTADISGGTPGVTDFKGYLDGDGHTISDLTAPLFTTVSGNGVVRNLNLSEVSISQSGNVGAIAGEATSGARIYNVGILGGSVGSTSGYCGGIIGNLIGMARVINCFSYADITAGTTVGGIVGYNGYASTQADLRTLVMNCMFYGNIDDGCTNRYPIYGGLKITNAGATGINNYNYYRNESHVKPNGNNYYNCALATEDRYLTRFEFYRGILNSNRELCAFYITGDPAITSVVAKWVLDPAVAPYPILKAQGKYPSVINRAYNDVSHGDNELYPVTYQNASVADFGAEPSVTGVYETDKSGYSTKLVTHNVGGKMGTLSVTMSRGSHGSGDNQTITLPITDMNVAGNDFCFRKVQLPYYNDYFEGNYGEYVVTGWEITTVTGNTTNTFTTGPDAYNFADTLDTGKDLYGTSGRVFAQGGYYYVPKDVTAISITAHWGKAYYLCDEYYDKVYTTEMAAYKFAPAGLDKRFPGSTKFNGQTVYTSWKTAAEAITADANATVYDNALVLVGNCHQYGADASVMRPNSNNNKSYTIMSVDLNHDNEPDYCLMHQFGPRIAISPVRFDFVYVPGMGMPAKVDGVSRVYNQGIYRVQGHFEVTETCVTRLTEFEYQSESKTAPLILNGGVFEQFVSTHESGTENTTCIILGGNVWFKQFCNGTHGDATAKRHTNHIPISVNGGEYEKFYLSGNFNSDVTANADNAECYINGGRFGEVAGAAQEEIKGNVTFKVNHAIIDEFYGGGMNKNKAITGNIDVTINNSTVGKYVAGPKFGNMKPDMTVTTHATGTTFGVYYGAGNGGTSLYKTKPTDHQGDYAVADLKYTKGGYSANGIATEYEIEYFAYAGGSQNNSRFYVLWASFDKAQTNTVTSTLKDCIVEGNYYGGGLLGAVTGDATSTLTNTIVHGSVYAAGYSADIPTLEVYDAPTAEQMPVYNGNTGVYTFPALSAHTTYTWSNEGSTSSTLTTTAGGEHLIYTDATLTGLGKVNGNATLTITSDGGKYSHVYGSVFGGGEQSAVGGNTLVTLSGTTLVNGSVFGGGNQGKVGGRASVTISDPEP